MLVPRVQIPNVPLMPSNTNSLLYHYMYNKYTTIITLKDFNPTIILFQVVLQLQSTTTQKLNL